MNKKLIRLTESDLHRIVKRSVNRILKEGSYDFDAGENPNKIQFKPLQPVIEDNKDTGEYNYYLRKLIEVNPNTDIYIDENDGSMSFYIGGDYNKKSVFLGNPYGSIFGSGDKKIFPYLWSTNGGKTAHAVDANGNIISVDFVADDGYNSDETLGLATDGNVYELADWSDSKIAMKFLSEPMCSKSQLIGRGRRCIYMRNSNGSIDKFDVEDMEYV